MHSLGAPRGESDEQRALDDDKKNAGKVTSDGLIDKDDLFKPAIKATMLIETSLGYLNFSW